jgi:hypothetical protein
MEQIKDHISYCVKEGLFDVRRIATAFLLLESCKESGKDENSVITTLKDTKCSIEDVNNWANQVYTINGVKDWITTIPSTEEKHFNEDDTQAKENVRKRYQKEGIGGSKFSCLVGSVDDLAGGVCELLNKRSIEFEYLRNKHRLCKMTGDIVKASERKEVWECSASGTKRIPWIGIDVHFSEKGIMYHCVPLGSL